METLRPQTTYIDGACYPYSKVIHFPTGGAQSRLIFNYWSNKVLSEEIRKLMKNGCNKEHIQNHMIDVFINMYYN